MTDTAARCFPILLFTVAGLLAATPAWAERQDEQLWTQVNINVPVTEKIRVTLEQIARFSDRQHGLSQTEFGGLIGARIAKGVEIGFGYRRVGSYGDNPAASENRLRQQVVAAFGPFTTRLRVDERFHPGGPEIGIRIRPLIRYNHKVGTRGVALFASHESFIMPNSTSWGQRSGYDRIRNIIGVAIPVGKHVNADIGYLNQYSFARGGSPGQMDHALTVQVTINLRGFAGPHVND